MFWKYWKRKKLNSFCQVLVLSILVSKTDHVKQIMMFNLYVSDLHEVTPPSMECVQYADDTSLYSHSNVKELDSRAVDMNETLASITNWSQDSNLALNPAKTKCMLFSTPQMSSHHSLAERPIQLSVGDKPVERVHSIKLLGVHMTDTLKSDDHVKHLASSCYGVLVALRKIMVS